MLKIENITSDLMVEEEKISTYRAKYTLGPLYRGYGHTIGNAIRRVLLSSVPGSAVKGVKIEGAISEFFTIEGVKENIVQILLNTKGLIIKNKVRDDKTMSLSIKGPKVVTAQDITHDTDIEIINKDHVIANVTDKIDLKMEFIVGTGEGFVSSSDVDKSDWPADFLPVDAIYSPIKNVSYQVEDTMVGRNTNFDKLILDIETNGSIKTKNIVSYAAELLMDHFKPFLKIGNRLTNLRNTDGNKKSSKAADKGSEIPEIRIEELDLSVRSNNCLKAAGVNTLRDLSSLTNKELLAIKNLGKSSVKEIVDKLAEFNVKVV